MNNKIKITTKIKAASLEASIQSNIEGEAKYFYYLKKYDKIIERVNWTNNTTVCFSLTESGTYHIQAHQKTETTNTIHYSEPIFYLTPDNHKEYLDYKKQDFNQPEKIEQYNPIYPYEIISFISTSNNDIQKALENTPNAFRITHIQTQKTSHVITKIKPKTINGKKAYLSGVAKVDHANNLIYGYENLTDGVDLSEATGSFNLLEITNNTISFKNDFFGVAKLYKYETQETIIVSNNIHALVNYLKHLNIKYTIDENQILSHFGILNHQPFHQLFSKNLPIINTTTLTPTESIFVNEYGNSFLIQTKLDQLIKTIKHQKDQYSYKNLVAQGAAEIIESTQAALNQNRFNNFIVDLSGGLDSRMVFAALTNTEHKKSSIYINSKESKTEPRDHIIACAINNIYNYNYDTLPTQSIQNELKLPWADHWSYYLINYFSYSPSISKRRHEKDTLRLVGFYGEIVARPYYTRGLTTDTEKNFISSYFDSHVHLSQTGSHTSIAATKDNFLSSVNSIPGSTSIEKFELHYAFYRNGLHCAPNLRSDYSCEEWSPLQSKSLFIAKHLYPEQGVNTQFNVIKKLNPLLIQIPFQSEKDELDRRKYIDSMIDEKFLKCEINLNYDTEKWKESISKKKSQESKIYTNEFNLFARDQSNALIKQGIQCWHYIIKKCPHIEKEIGPNVWHLMQPNNNDVSIQTKIYLTNRIVGICEIINA